MLNQTKSMLASRGVWGGATALLAGLAGLLGYSVSPADQVSLVNLATGLAAAVGGILAIIGRIRATKRIG